MKFTISLAGIPIGVESIHEQVYALCRDYLTEEEPVFRVATTPENLCYEREKSRREALLEGRCPEAFSDSYLETLAVYRHIAVALLSHDTLLMHGSVVAVSGAAYLFTARSGTGKTTHTELWLRHIPGAFIVNGDKPLLKLTDHGVSACGTPWAGKEGRNRNCMVPLAAICLLERGKENEIEPLRFAEAFPMLLQQSYRPREPQAMEKTLELLKQLGGAVRFYRLRCNREPEAALLAYEVMHEREGDVLSAPTAAESGPQENDK